MVSGFALVRRSLCLLFIPFSLISPAGAATEPDEAVLPVIAGEAWERWRDDAPAHPYRFWVGETGPTGPLFSGPQQYPFVCWTEISGLGQPLADNQDGRGSAVFAVDGDGNKTDTVIGYSAACSVPTRVDYFYRSTDGRFKALASATDRPADLARTTLADGRSVDYVVRLERGTINRFIYGIAMLAPSEPDALHINRDAWNRRLVYSFGGGVGIGRWQGELALDDVLLDAALARGYAVAASTGNITGVHYNLTLAAETALMVKRHFSAVYGKPVHTIGVGGSGGGVQQYVLGQNFPGLIDGAVALMSYSDMVTQTTYALDCQLLEHYFDVTGRANPKWADWTRRSLVEGLSASNTVINRWTGRPGSSECVQAWRSAEATVLNPRYADPQYFQSLQYFRFPAEVIASVRWTHWDDLRNVYGLDDTGYARRTWDNVGVQYGLRALVAGTITKEEFLHLNATVGGWKRPSEMLAVNYPWNPNADPRTLDLWDRQSMMLSPDGGATPAPRTHGDPEAMRAAWRTGQVFTGRFRIPVIDARWYLDPLLDMHHAQQSFVTRARMLKARGRADNQAIWVGLPPYDPTAEALGVMEEWLSGMRGRWWRDAGAARPASAADKCFDATGRALASGDQVWNGILDGGAPGACTALFPPNSTSRIVAGGSIEGDIFKCRTVPVAEAQARGIYGGVSFTAEELLRLEQIFPEGVCDYSQPDAVLPPHHRHR